MGAMNEPKDVSVSKLRDYLSVYHAEYNTDNRPHVLKTALDRAVAKGWIIQISGKGFSGTYRLCPPYYPSPRELWGKDFVEPKEPRAKAEPSPKKKAVKRAAAASDSEEESEDEDEEEEEAYKPKKGKRGPPSPRKTAEASPKKKAKASPAKKPAANKKSKPTKAKARKGASRGKK